jgi:hypothetical protein
VGEITLGKNILINTLINVLSSKVSSLLEINSQSDTVEVGKTQSGGLLNYTVTQSGLQTKAKQPSAEIA